MAVILGVAIAITFLLLPLSVYPGLPSELAFLAFISSPFWMPVACVSLWVFVDMAHQAPDISRRRRVNGAGSPPPRRCSS